MPGKKQTIAPGTAGEIQYAMVPHHCTDFWQVLFDQSGGN
jgi:hypothetical protein